MALVEQAVPCILHSDMIITEKFVKLIIQQGINFYIDERQSYVEELETLMNTHVCGSGVGRIGQRIFPYAIADKNMV